MKGHIINIFGFEGHVVSCQELRPSAAGAHNRATDSMKVSGCGCMPIKLYLQAGGSGLEGSAGSNLSTSALAV